MCVRVEMFRGRESIIEQVKSYVLGSAEEPLVLHGHSGSGKTSIIAKSASLIKSWFPTANPAIILRFFGTLKTNTHQVYYFQEQFSGNVILFFEKG